MRELKNKNQTTLADKQRNLRIRLHILLRGSLNDAESLKTVQIITRFVNKTEEAAETRF